jgi:hypothetical protein
LDVLEWLHYNGCPWNANRCNAVAAAGGHLNVLKYLSTSGYTCDKTSCENAAYGGRINVLEWIRTNGANGYNFDESIWESAVNGGHLAV